MLIFSQSNVNIMIDTKKHPILCIFQIKQNKFTVIIKGANSFDVDSLQVSLSLAAVLMLSRLPS